MIMNKKITFLTKRNKKRSNASFNTYLKNVGQISQIEDVVKLNGGWEKSAAHFSMQGQGGLGHGWGGLLHSNRKPTQLEMLAHNAAVDR